MGNVKCVVPGWDLVLKGNAALLEVNVERAGVFVTLLIVNWHMAPRAMETPFLPEQVPSKSLVQESETSPTAEAACSTA